MMDYLSLKIRMEVLKFPENHTYVTILDIKVLMLV